MIAQDNQDFDGFVHLKASVEAPFIVNGRNATWGEFPWQVSIELPTYDIDGSDGHLCGGSILSDRWIVTAGHCIVVPAGAMRILANVITRSTDRLTTGQIVNITVHYRHEDYNPDAVNVSYPNDIALLELDDPLVWAEQAQPIPLPLPDEDFVGRECWISGWGTIQGPLQLAQDTLRCAETDVITNEECQTRVDGIGNIWDGHLCIYNGVSGACSGDSGGPLACRDSTGKYVLAGVTSWGVVAFQRNSTDGTDVVCSTDYPSAYTRVSEYVDWIRNIAPEIPAPQ